MGLMAADIGHASQTVTAQAKVAATRYLTDAVLRLSIYARLDCSQYATDLIFDL